MSMKFDLAEAVSNGIILVDEIDVIEAVEKGKLSKLDGARFSAVLEGYSKFRDIGSAIVKKNSVASPLTDEIEDLNKEEGSTTDESILDVTQPTLTDDEWDDKESMGTATKSVDWNRILVDEVDFLNAFKNGQVDCNDSHIASIRNETTSAIGHDLDIEMTKITVNDENAKSDSESHSEGSDILI